jgi:hypothetical protein
MRYEEGDGQIILGHGAKRPDRGVPMEGNAELTGQAW